MMATATDENYRKQVGDLIHEINGSLGLIPAWIDALKAQGLDLPEKLSTISETIRQVLQSVHEFHLGSRVRVSAPHVKKEVWTDTRDAEASLSQLISPGNRALVIEDEVRWRREIASLLSSRGLEVDEAGNTQEAMALITTRTYDIAFVDMILNSHFEGMRLLSVIRDASPQALIVVLTGWEMGEQAKDAFELGANTIVAKSDFSVEGAGKLLDGLVAKQERSKEALFQEEWRRYLYEVLATFSHELRQPLHVILRNTDALALGALGKLNSRQQAAIRSIKNAALRELLLINAHLDMNRIEKGVARINARKLNVVSLVRDEIAAHRAEARRRKVRLRSRLPKLPIQVRLDVSRFRAVLNPLLENAIKFSKPGEAVEVSAKPFKSYIEISIEDHGPGMKPDEIDALLMWRPEQPELSGRIRISGLGLSMARRIVELHSGRLWITSDGETGTTVNFRLPMEE
jgi:signal transduction histidine kinase